MDSHEYGLVLVSACGQTFSPRALVPEILFLASQKSIIIGEYILGPDGGAAAAMMMVSWRNN